MPKRSRVRVLSAAGLVLLLSCSDEPTAPPVEPADPPAGLSVVVPDTVVRGDGFEVRVEAVDAEGLPADGWSGTVTLASSQGSISPGEVEVVDGRGVVQATISGHAGAVAITASIGAVQSDPMPLLVLSSDPAVRIEVEPAAALLPGVGEGRHFEARAYDASGAPTDADVVWRTTDGAMLTIDASGVATAQAIGSAQVIAAVGAVESTPALVIVAEVADDAVLVADSQIVVAPVPTDPLAPYEPGWRYRVVVSGAAPAVGALVLGDGSVPLAGRVAAAQPASGGTELTVELVPLNELFTDLVIDEEIPMVELGGGGASSAPGIGPSSARGGGRRGPSRYGADAVEFDLGPFSCEADGTVPDVDLPDPDLDIKPRLGLRILYANGQLEELVVVGELEADFSFKPVIEIKFTGEISCETELRTMTVPLNGWLSYFYGVQVPVGIGFRMDAELEVGKVGFELTATATANAELGLRCPGGGSCEGVREFELTRDMEFEFITPDPEDDYRVQVGLEPFVFARPKLGSVLTQALDYDLIDAEAGLRQSVDLAAPHYQVEDTAYSSSFDLRLLIEVQPAEDLQKGIQSLGKILGKAINAAFDLLSVDDTLATSPKGTLTIDPDTVAPGDSTQLGDLATFTVQLDTVEYLGLYAVDAVELMWEQREEDADTFTLVNGRPPCTTLEASSGQRTFECEVDFLKEHDGEQPFHAFVHAKLFGLTLPVPLEVAVDTVYVDGCPAVAALIATTQAEVDSIGALPACRVQLIYLSEQEGSEDPIVDVSPLFGIREIFWLQVHNTTQLVDFTGMDSTAVHAITLQNNAALTSLNGLGTLIPQSDATSFSVTIVDNPVLGDISVLARHMAPSGVTAGTVILRNLPSLTSTAGLDGIDRIDGALQVNYTALSSLGGLGDVTHVGGLLMMEGNANLTGLSMSLDTLPTDVILTANDALQTIAFDIGYAGEETLNGFRINLHEALQAVDVHVESGSAGLHVREAPSLSELRFTSASGTGRRIAIERTGLARITAFDMTRLDHRLGGVWISENPNLTSIDALRGLDHVGDLGFNIAKNPKLCVPDWIEDIDIVGGTFLNENQDCE